MNIPNPLYQVGDTYFPEPMRNGQWTTPRGGDELFSDNDAALVYYKKQFFREFIYQVLFETTTPYWREVMAESQLAETESGPQVLDGQKAMRYIISKFPENLEEYLNTLCAKVLDKEFNVVGAEDPGPKFAEIAKIYKAIRRCPSADPNEFGIAYYLRLIKMHLNANPHYHVPRESGYILHDVAQDCYAANKVGTSHPTLNLLAAKSTRLTRPDSARLGRDLAENNLTWAGTQPESCQVDLECLNDVYLIIKQ